MIAKVVFRGLPDQESRNRSESVIKVHKSDGIKGKVELFSDQKVTERRD